MAYFSYLSILYTYIRVPGLIDSTTAVDYVFEQLFTYKQYEATTWFHHACYKAMKKDKTGAIESLDKSLKLGFGSYYQLIGDKDLDFIRQTPEFNALLKKYFPGDKNNKK